MKKRFNIVDALLILLIVAAIAVCFLFLRSRGSIGPAEGTDVHFTVELRRVSREMIDRVEAAGIGSNVYRSTDGEYLGTLEDFRYETHVETEFASALGEYAQYEVSDRYLLYLDVVGQGTQSATDISVNGSVIKIGQEIFVKGKGYAAGGYVVGVSVDEMVEDSAVGVGDKELVYSVRFEDIRAFTAEQFRVGDRLYDNATGVNLGVITDVDIRPYADVRMDENGNAKFCEKPGKYSAYVTLTARCTETENSYFIDGRSELKVGAMLQGRTKWVLCGFTYNELLEVREIAE